MKKRIKYPKARSYCLDSYQIFHRFIIARKQRCNLGRKIVLYCYKGRGYYDCGRASLRYNSERIKFKEW